MSTPEERLRDALHTRADLVEPSPDALPRIRARTAGPARRWLPAFAVATAVAATVALAVVTFVPDRVPSPTPMGTATAESPTAAPTPVAPPETAAPAPAQVPVYYVRGDRLFREYHRLEVRDGTAGRITAAVTEMLREGSAADPDYTTLWPAGIAVRGVSVVDGVAVIDLDGLGTEPRGPAPLAMQQLVWTVAAAVAETEVRVEGVRILVAGAPAGRIWGAIDGGQVQRQAPQVDVLAPVWVIEPHHGTATGRTFTVHLAGTVFEATVRLRVRGPSGIVHDEAVTLDRGAPARGERKLQLTLPPGRYTVEAYYTSAKDGSVQAVDDHDFTVAG